MGTRSNRYAVLAAGALLGSALLTGCGGDEKPSPPPTGGGTVAGGPTTAPPTSDPSGTTTSSDPTTSSTSKPPKSSKPPKTKSPGEAGAPGVPKAARQHTSKGAEAFARHYIDVINRTGQHPSLQPLHRLAQSGCKSCASFESGVKYMVKHHEHQTGPVFRINKSQVIEDPDKRSVRVRVELSELPIRVVDDQGKTQRKSHPRDSYLEFMTIWTASGWRIDKIYVPAA
ncbi:DUF6318 family protein [Segeticoccus rhizosphaerae]|uniref:DUF6318 family protein n=1 Tax=Segeticoccus rhizosphaerae TaxID=1104777 RepID=UPI0010BF7C11|nr:DUF6318 family protein [Ornithinicoccus soli]